MKSEKMKGLLSDVLWIVITLVLVFVIIKYVGQRTVVNGASMEATLQDGDNLILDKLSYRFSDPKRFDVVVFPGEYDENGREVLYIKRIIGLPGETLEIKDGLVYINGELLEEDVYARDGYTGMDYWGTDHLEVTLGEDEYFCMGDNRSNSVDSREPAVGPVHISEIDGKIFIRIFPFNKFGKID